MNGLIKNIFSTKKRILFAMIVLVAVGLLIWNNIFKTKDELKTGKVEKGLVTEDLILSGEVNADEYANLSFQTSGELSFIGVKEGEEVKKGEVLAKLDTTVLYQAYLQAESDLRRYQASLDNTYDQLQGNEKNESYTQIETRTVAEVNKDKAYRSYVAAQKNLANAILKAPFDGLISSITYPFTGINTVFSQPQIVMFNPKTIYFETSADQTEVTKLREGQEVKIVLDSFSDEEFQGSVVFIGNSPKVGESAVYKVKVQFSEDLSTSNKYKIGMTGDAKFIISEKQEALYVPSEFIKSDSNGRYILVSRKNKVYVDVGLEGEDRVEILGDRVKEGDIVYD